MKLNMIKSIYKSKLFTQTEKSLMTTIVLNMDKDKKCTLAIKKLADDNNIATHSAWRIIKRLVKKQAVKQYTCAAGGKMCTYELAI